MTRASYNKKDDLNRLRKNDRLISLAKICFTEDAAFYLLELNREVANNKVVLTAKNLSADRRLFEYLLGPRKKTSLLGFLSHGVLSVTGEKESRYENCLKKMLRHNTRKLSNRIYDVLKNKHAYANGIVQ